MICGTIAKKERKSNVKSIKIDAKRIYIHGKETKIMSGAMHYFRIHPEYWYDRLLKLKECGCNCVETYAVWNLHEKKEGEFDFSGWLDLGRFLDTAKDLGLYAIVRPGPYICSEWDFGGLPRWLLKDKGMKVRCSHPSFLEKMTPYLERVCEIMKPRMLDNGGNIIFVQVENEYGSYGDDKEYLEYFKNLYLSNGVSCPLITSDGDIKMLLDSGTLPDVLASVNYRWDSVSALKVLDKFRGNQPGMVMELWNGKAMHWGEPIIKRDLKEVADSVETALDNAELVNLYMFHGGTNFGFMNGTMDMDNSMIYQMTSYDVDAPLDEYGRRTPKYYAEQKVICEKMGVEIKNTAADTVLYAYDGIKAEGTAKISYDMVKKIKAPTVLTMEDCDSGYGYIVYETEFNADLPGLKIVFPEIHDIAHIYIDGEYTKTLLRHSNEKEISVEKTGTVKLSVLVENMGRVNYGTHLEDRKGLVGDIEVIYPEADWCRKKHFGYDIYTLPLETLPKEYHDEVTENTPALYRYTFTADNICDTVLNLSGFTRGVAFINGFNLGRHWTTEHSPNKLFIPAPLLKKGVNEIVVFDVLANGNEKNLTFGE